MHTKPTAILIPSIALFALLVTAVLLTDTTSVLARSSPGRNTKALLQKVSAAQAALATNNFGLFLEQLRSVDATRPPKPVQRAFSNYVLAAEAAAAASALGRSNEARDLAKDADRELRQAIERQLARRP